MKSFFNIIKLDYLQRTRNYNFLITLCASLAIAYTFVPEPNANYSTIRISDYVGYYNSAWFGYVTAIMSSLFLSLIGFFLINSGIKNDIDTKVGQMIAATPIKNFGYLLAKTISNFLLLFSIILVVFLMSILLFFLYNDGYDFKLIDFIKPYCIITIPALFFIASLGVVFEVIFPKYTVLQNVIFFFLFFSLLLIAPKNTNEFALDVFGSKIVMHQLEEKVKTITNTQKTTKMSIGYVLANTKKPNKFEFNGVEFSTIFILSRLIWIIVGLGLVGLSSLLFHRFTLKKKFKSSRKQKLTITQLKPKELNLNNLITATINYSILPLLKTEFILSIRKGKKWLWILNIIGMILLGYLPLEIAHKIVLPILWFLQVHRISDIATKEKSFGVHLFASSSYKPIQRIFTSKIIASMLLMFIISSPLIIKYIFSYSILNALSIVLGLVFLIFVAVLFGQISKGKKLFEVVFFLVTYANINGIVFFDYFGGTITSSTQINFIGLVILLLLGTTFYTKHKKLN